ncbi:hypothetical protein BDR04DRAFT_219362 [Suillus decipiens]|nr:hypothetical protein BDR04DRAFT_219362 [Suillus decipiens]
MHPSLTKGLWVVFSFSNVCVNLENVSYLLVFFLPHPFFRRSLKTGLQIRSCRVCLSHILLEGYHSFRLSFIVIPLGDVSPLVQVIGIMPYCRKRRPVLRRCQSTLKNAATTIRTAGTTATAHYKQLGPYVSSKYGTSKPSPRESSSGNNSASGYRPPLYYPELNC